MSSNRRRVQPPEQLVVPQPTEDKPHFDVIGPRGISTPRWTYSTYRRIAISCFVEAVYLLELDRQDKRDESNQFAPSWWQPFMYKPVRILHDRKDGSIYGALLECDESVGRPTDAPSAVLALRGTILKRSTMMRDIADDLRFFATENLTCSARFAGALEVMQQTIKTHGCPHVCIAGHSLGAGIALQVGKALAKEGFFVECHLFNPPSASIATIFRRMKEKVGTVLRRQKQAANPPARESSGNLAQDEEMTNEVKPWVPTLYINNSDYVCCHYEDRAGATSTRATKKWKPHYSVAATLFVIAKGPRKFMQAHGLQQWWSHDLDVRLGDHNTRLVFRQLKSLYIRRQRA